MSILRDFNQVYVMLMTGCKKMYVYRCCCFKGIFKEKENLYLLDKGCESADISACHIFLRCVLKYK
jgi:hypothetical protein